jgi:tRNA(Ile)-lysidine synthase
MSMNLFILFKKNLQTQGLIQPGDRIVIGVSGGIDSIVLLDLLDRLRKTIPLHLIVGHLNHNVRGKESDLDAQFVEKITFQRKLTFQSKKLEAGALKKKGNFQEEARRARYAFLAKIAHQHRISKIVTAHQADDQVETFLMRLLRGAGTEGLKGIAPIRPLDEDRSLSLIRPLLLFSREQIFQYARERKLKWREDSTNPKVDYLRNRVRHRLLTEMKKINPRVIESISKSLVTLREEDLFLEDWIDQRLKKHYIHDKKGVRVDLNWLQKQSKAIRYRIYRRCLEEASGSLLGVQRIHLDALEEMVASHKKTMRITLPKGYGACLSKSQFIIKGWRKRKALEKRGFFG